METSEKPETPFPIFSSTRRQLGQLIAIVEADLRKIKHDPYELFMRMIQPSIWLLIFGQAMSTVKAIPTGNLSYLDYIAPGILAQSILFIGIFYGIALIWERDMGIGQVLTMPIFFASNALYPIEMMPNWLQVLSTLNPLTYQVNALRSFMITGHSSTGNLLVDFSVSLVTFAVLIAIAAKVYPKIIY